MFPRDPVEFLFSLERLGMKFGLDNMQALCEALGHPERDFPSIIVAGTNGKGSVTAMVAAGLQAAGHRCGRYTSPHLLRLEERFTIAGEEISRAHLAASAGRIKSAVESLLAEGALDGPPTFFECTTAVAFDLFREASVDLAVLEVGLGGRLDATNVVTPIAAGITSIAFDHEAQLGNTLAAIAREKAGVIKAGIPVVCGPLPPEAFEAIQAVAVGERATIIKALDEVTMTVTTETDRLTVDVRTARRVLRHVTLGLRGRHQADNAAVAVSLLEVLEGAGYALPDDALRAGLTDTSWPARLEYFRYAGCDILLDAAHNPAGTRALADHLRQRGWLGITLVFGAMQDKAVLHMLEPLLPLCARLICTTAATARAMPGAALARLLAEGAGRAVDIETVEDPAEALAAAVQADTPVVIAGSIFLVGPLRDILR